MKKKDEIVANKMVGRTCERKMDWWSPNDQENENNVSDHIKDHMIMKSERGASEKTEDRWNHSDHVNDVVKHIQCYHNVR